MTYSLDRQTSLAVWQSYRRQAPALILRAATIRYIARPQFDPHLRSGRVERGPDAARSSPPICAADQAAPWSRHRPQQRPSHGPQHQSGRQYDQSVPPDHSPDARYGRPQHRWANNFDHTRVDPAQCSKTGRSAARPPRPMRRNIRETRAAAEAEGFWHHPKFA